MNTQIALLFVALIVFAMGVPPWPEVGGRDVRPSLLNVGMALVAAAFIAAWMR